MTISRSEGSRNGRSSGVLHRGAPPIVSRVHGASSSSASTQVAVQTGELLLPELPVRLQPVIDAPERRRDERTGTALRIAPARDQASAFEDLEMLGDRRLAEGKRLHEFGHVRIARCETGEDGAPGRIGERRKGQAQGIGPC